jgi:hypothetical protein
LVFCAVLSLSTGGSSGARHHEVFEIVPAPRRLDGLCCAVCGQRRRRQPSAFRPIYRRRGDGRPGGAGGENFIRHQPVLIVDRLVGQSVTDRQLAALRPQDIGVHRRGITAKRCQTPPSLFLTHRSTHLEDQPWDLITHSNFVDPWPQVARPFVH